MRLFRKQNNPSGYLGQYVYKASAAERDNLLLCDGRAVSRATYSALFADIGTAFGAGNGTTTFNLPDMRGRVPGGAGQGVGLTVRAVGANVGEETHTLTVPEMPAHTHSVETVQTASQNGWAGGDVRANSTTKNTTSAGGGGAHNNMQPTAFAGYWFICAAA